MQFVAQVAAAFGVFIRSKNREMKSVSLSAGITGIFGITEPTIYGVTLRLKNRLSVDVSEEPSEQL